MPSPLVIALAVSLLGNVWLAVTRTAARRTALDLNEQLYLTASAANHLVNGTVSGDPDVVDEMNEIRFCAYSLAEAGDRLIYQLPENEQTAIRVAARRRLVLEGHMTLDDPHRGNGHELDTTAADIERAATEALLARAAL